MTWRRPRQTLRLPSGGSVPRVGARFRTMAHLLRVVVIVFGGLLLLTTQVFSAGPDGVRTYNIAGVVIDIAAVLMIVAIAWSWRRKEPNALTTRR